MVAAEACYSFWQPGWAIQTQKPAQMTRVAFSWSQYLWPKLAMCHLGESSEFCLPVPFVCAQSIQKFAIGGTEQERASAYFPNA